MDKMDDKDKIANLRHEITQLQDSNLGLTLALIRKENSSAGPVTSLFGIPIRDIADILRKAGKI